MFLYVYFMLMVLCVSVPFWRHWADTCEREQSTRRKLGKLDMLLASKLYTKYEKKNIIMFSFCVCIYVH